MYKKITAIILCIILMMALLPAASLAESIPFRQLQTGTRLSGTFDNDMQPNGELVVYLLKNNDWKELQSLSYDRFLSRKEIKLTDIYDNTEINLKIVQKQGGNSHIDAVLLNGKAPVKANGDDNLIKKLSKQDYDVINLDNAGLELSFAPSEKNATLEICARIEGAVISDTPFLFPVQRGPWVIDNNSTFYQYQINSKNKTPKVDNLLQQLSTDKPFLKEVCIPGSGHPQGFIYGWVANDNDNLYVALDVTGDNTMDGDKDYAKVYSKTAEGLKEFKLSVPETKWGKASFIYTDKVAYQHKVYEFVIPLEEIGVSDIDTVKVIPIAFSVYGTMSDPICFEFNNYSQNEDDEIITIKVLRPSGYNNQLGTAVVSYSAAEESTAVAGLDYTIEVNGELVFDNGATEKTFNVRIIDDDIYEPEIETIKLSLSIEEGLLSTVLGTDGTTISIFDNDYPSIIQFERRNNETEERDGISVYITRSGNPEGTADVQYTITDVTATAGEDYNFSQTGIVNFEAGETKKDLWIPIVNDNLVEENETFKITLSNATNGFAIGEIGEAIVTILDNDEPETECGTIQFETSRYSIKENGGEAEITVVYTPEEPEYNYIIGEGDQSEASEVYVYYSTSDGTAKAGSDYTEASGILTFNEEELIKTFTVPIINDLAAEANETINLILTEASGVELGRLSEAVLTIINDDKESSKPSKSKNIQPKEIPPSTKDLPNGTIIGRMNGYIVLGDPVKIADGSNEIQMSYNAELSQKNPNNNPRVYYWNNDKKNWVALTTYPLENGKVKAINDNSYKGWFVVFGVVEPSFSDLNINPIEQLLNRMNGLGILEGYPISGERTLKTAKPDQNVTRAEFAMLITRILNIDVDDNRLPLISEAETITWTYRRFSDSNRIPSWVLVQIGTLIRGGFIAEEGNVFRAADPITRIEASVMVSKALKLLTDCKPADLSTIKDADQIPEWAKQELVEGVITSYLDGTIRPNDNIKRSDAFEMLYKLFVIGLGW